jgi:hypothetical protein
VSSGTKAKLQLVSQQITRVYNFIPEYLFDNQNQKVMFFPNVMEAEK